MKEEVVEKQTLRIEEAAKILGIGRISAYAAVKRGEIPTIQIGGLKLVSKPALEAMLRNAGNQTVKLGE